MRVALLDDSQQVALTMAPFEASLPGDEIVAFSDHLSGTDDLVDRLMEFDVIVAMRERTPLGSDVIERLPRLRLIVSTGRRNASIDAEVARSRGVVVCGTDTLPWPAVELTWALILSLVRNIPRETDSVRSGGWQVTLGEGLNGKMLGILGLGRLGSRVARVGEAFGMEVVAWSPSLTDERAAAGGVRRIDRDELIGSSDVVTIHAKLSEATRGSVGRNELRSMKSSAYLINTARGPIVDEPALVQALQEGWIAGAGIDVFDEEPLPADSLLRTAPRALLTPHLGYATRDSLEVCYGQALKQILAFKSGASLTHLES